MNVTVLPRYGRLITCTGDGTLSVGQMIDHLNLEDAWQLRNILLARHPLLMPLVRKRKAVTA